jgi:hypothetical protein
LKIFADHGEGAEKGSHFRCGNEMVIDGIRSWVIPVEVGG